MRGIVLSLGAMGIGIVVACGGDDGAANNANGSSTSSGGATSTSSSTGGASSTSSSGGVTSSTSSSGGGTPGPGTMHAGCRIFPNDNPWNTDVSGLPVDTALMTTVMPNMAQSTGVHPDWGTVTDHYGIPITVGKAATTPANITFHTSYGDDESDQLVCNTGNWCYPIPLDAKIEGGSGASQGSDRHILFLATDNAPNNCVLYELFNAYNPTAGGYSVGSAAIFKLDTNALRTEGWTSADAAGLPVLAGLVRRDEVVKGEITHALRFTMDASRSAYMHPATHAAGDVDDTLPPMGLRVRLKASFSETGISPKALVVIKAMKKYGMILADNGSNWFVSGEEHEDWGPDMDDLLGDLGKVKGSDFEIVKTGEAIIPVAN